MLNRESFQKAMEDLRKPQSPEPHVHIVHPKALEDDSIRYVVCADCFMTLDKWRWKMPEEEL